MRKIQSSIEEAKDVVQSFYGQDVIIRYNKGRNNIVNMRGRVKEIYPNLFILSVEKQPFDRLCVSYAEVICGEVSLKSAKK